MGCATGAGNATGTGTEAGTELRVEGDGETRSVGVAKTLTY